MLFDLPPWSIPLMMTITLCASACVIHWISFAPAVRPKVETFIGLVGPFFGSPAILFALLTGFIANDAWTGDRHAATLALEEHDADSMLSHLAGTVPTQGVTLQGMIGTYVQAVLDNENPNAPRPRDSEADVVLTKLLKAVAVPDFANATNPAMQSAMIDAVERVAEARSRRLALAETGVESAKWVAALALAFLSQIGAAAVHLERRRAQGLALTIFTLAAIVLLGLIATCERPYLQSHLGDFASLQEFLTPSAPTR